MLRQEAYRRPLYRRGGGRNYSKPQSLNIGTDLEINGYLPECDVIRRSRGKGGYLEILDLGGRVRTGEKTYPRPIGRIFPSPRAYRGRSQNQRTFCRI